MHYAYPTDIVLQLLTTTLTRHPHPTQAYSQGAPLTHDCYTLHNSKAQDTRSINICQIFFSRFNDLFKTRPSSIGQKYNICISLHVNYFNFSYNINFNI